MSASPQLVRSESPSNRTFRDTNFDPFLSAPVDPEESFASSVRMLTPVNGEDHSVRGSTSPSLHHHPLDYSSTNGDGHPGSLSDFLSPTDDFSSTLSAHTSPGPECIDPHQLNTHLDINGWQQHVQNTSPNPSDLSSPQATLHPSSLLTPNLTNNPSPSSSMKSQQHAFGVNPPQPLTLITTPPDDNLQVDAPDSAMARSPIVKVISVSRGDSPDRGSFYSRGRSTSHLSPGDQSSESGDEGPSDRYLNNRLGVARSHDGSWLPSTTTGQAGVDPLSRGDAIVPSPNEMEYHRQLNERNADILMWSETVSQANSEAGDVPPYRGRKSPVRSRRRAKSAGDPSSQQDYFNFNKGAGIPGPGMLVHVSSDEGDSDNGSDFWGSADGPMESDEADSVPSPKQASPEEENVSPSDFRGTPWMDPGSEAPSTTVRGQPVTSSQAIMEYHRRARETDNLSRVATWGTRPLSQADFDSFVGDASSMRGLTLDEKRGKKHGRQNSLFKLLHVKPSNGLKRQLSDLSSKLPSSENPANKAEEAKSPPQRKDSFPHLGIRRSSRSPSLSSGVLAITNQMAAIGGKETMKVASPSSSTSPSWSSFKRGRSRSDVPRNAAPGLMDLMRTHGGPPVANITSSPQAVENPPTIPQKPVDRPVNGDDDDDDEDMVDEQALVMEFPVQLRLPVPTMEGFKTQIIQLNPRLQPALVDRFAHEQLCRYRKLVEYKTKHSQVVGKKSCSAGAFCFAQGGEAKILAPRANPQDADATHTQFQIPGHDETDDHSRELGEGAVTAAQFPPGVLLPPVKRLPAEFECPICFKVKKFQKPSDWTKHVHEDVQPFTCTFPSCPEPKSFKRKADWVRHENERHRQLEWWTCTFADCTHTCYRKDNFVQHLVREHKMPEPKVKKTKTKNAGQPNGPEMQEESQREREIERLWDLVERCRHDTPKSPREEPCRFCGNVCSSWKKLTVHLAKHMEQIAMPVLGLVKERNPSYHPAGSGRARPEAIVQETRSFAPRLEGVVPPGPDMSMNLTQAPPPAPPATTGHYAERSGGGLAAPFHPTYPPPHLTTMPGTMISEEPESMETFNGVPYGGGAQAGLQLGVPTDHSRLLPVHQNSVTYPPAGPRLKVSQHDLNLNVLQDPYHYAMSPTEMAAPPATYDGQESMYLTTNHYGYADPVAQSMSYDPSQGYRG